MEYAAVTPKVESYSIWGISRRPGGSSRPNRGTNVVMALRNEAPEWCPWDAADRMNVQVLDLPMTAGYYAASIWRPKKTIYLKLGMPLMQARCTLTRELLRLRQPVLVGRSNAAVIRHERALTRATARLLIPLDALVEAIRWVPSCPEQAEALMVDVRTLKARLRWLTEEEWRAVTAIVEVASA